MAFARWSRESHFEALELDGKGQPTGPAAKVFASTRLEYSPRFSPDGSRVVFQSSRSGASGTWVCESAGANCFPVSPPGQMAANPDWSPDGKWIAFNTNSESGIEIDLVRSDGGTPKLLTRGTPEFDGAMLPRWSRNGRWIYFRCGARPQICRVASSGGVAQPVPGAEGMLCDESPDGWLYFSIGGEIKPGQLKRVPVSGGAATEIVSQVWGRNWAVTATGVWYVAPRGNDLRYLDLATGATRTVFRTEKPVLAGLAVSPDQRRIIFSQGKEIPESDIMLVENFR
jgi:WD40-like Beta Propeller Repeat